MAMRLTPITAGEPAACDRCPARATVETRHNGKPLTWCRHHYHKHENALGHCLVVYMSDEVSKEPQPA